MQGVILECGFILMSPVFIYLVNTFTSSGAKENNGIIGDFSMFLFPIFNVIDGYMIVAPLMLRDIYDNTCA